MSKLSKVFWIGIGFILVVIFLLWLNGMTSDCDANHIYNNQTDLCYYESTQELCSGSDESFDGVYCSYNPRNFLSSGLIGSIIVIIIIIGLLWIIISNTKNIGKVNVSEFDSKDYVTPKRASEIIVEEIVKQNNIYHYYNKMGFGYRKDAIKVSLQQEPFRKKNYEWFCQYEIEIFEGDNIGIYTLITSLSRGEEWIRGHQYRLVNVLYDEYNESPVKRPMYQLQDKQERQAEMLMSQGRVTEAQKILISDNSSVGNNSHDDITPEERELERETLQQSTDKRRVENKVRTRYSRRGPYGR